MGSVTNRTGAPLWLRSPTGVVISIAIGQQAQALAAGNYNISTTPLDPTPPLPKATAITFTNVGTVALDFAATPPAVAPSFNLPHNGAALLATIAYTITTSSNGSSPASITNGTDALLWLRSPAGVVVPIAAGQQATLVVGNYNISTTVLPPTPPLPVTTAVTFTNVGAVTLDFTATPPAVAPPFDLPHNGAAVLASIPYTIKTSSDRSTTGFITNSTGAPLWLRTPAGVVIPVAAGEQVPVWVGNHNISTTRLPPTLPLPVELAITFHNVGTVALDFGAIPPAVAPPFNLPPRGAAILAPIPYNITPSSNGSTPGSITNSTGAPLWLRTPAGVVIPVAAAQQVPMRVGNHNISTTGLPPTPPLPVELAITVHNVGTTALSFAAIPPAVAPPFSLPPRGAAVLAPIPYTVIPSSNGSTLGSVRNSTGAPLWLRTPAGAVIPIAAGQQVDVGVGNHNISTTGMPPTPPLPVELAITFHNVGTVALNFAAIPPAVAPPFNLPPTGAAILLAGPYNITL